MRSGGDTEDQFAQLHGLQLWLSDTMIYVSVLHRLQCVLFQEHSVVLFIFHCKDLAESRPRHRANTAGV